MSTEVGRASTSVVYGISAGLRTVAGCAMAMSGSLCSCQGTAVSDMANTVPAASISAINTIIKGNQRTLFLLSIFTSL